MVKKEANIQYINQSDDLKLGLINLADFADLKAGGKREVEKTAARYVVANTAGNTETEILYEESGRPYLQDGPHISISHSHDLLGVLFSKKSKRVGLDIEKVREKVLGIKHKFLSETELTELKNEGALKFTLYWAAKEAVYKAAGIEGLLFAEQIRVLPFELNAGGGQTNVRVNTPLLNCAFSLKYFLLDDYVIVYTLND